MPTAFFFFAKIGGYQFKKAMLFAKMMSMETRMERYASYREKIRRMPADTFPQAKDAPNEKEKSDEPIIPPSSGQNPFYSLYAKRKRRYYWIVGSFFLVVVACFIVFYFLYIHGRS